MGLQFHKFSNTPKIINVWILEMLNTYVHTLWLNESLQIRRWTNKQDCLQQIRMYESYSLTNFFLFPWTFRRIFFQIFMDLVDTINQDNLCSFFLVDRCRPPFWGGFSAVFSVPNGGLSMSHLSTHGWLLGNHNSALNEPIRGWHL